MTTPLRVEVPPHVYPDPARTADRPPRWWRRAADRVGRVSRCGVAWLARPARLLPGVGALGCAIAGSFILWGAGVALLVAVPFLLLLDARTPRP